MTSPDLNRSENAGYGAGTDSAGRSSTNGGSGSAAGGTDDVSFARSIGVDQPPDKVDQVKDMAQRGIASAEDAMSQLQAKASELTSNLIDRVNVEEMTQRLEQQVRDHPTRTLLFAAGAGFLLGRAAKK